MEQMSREKRRELLMVRMHIAFEKAFPNTPASVIEEFCFAFFENRFSEIEPHMQVVAKARVQAALSNLAMFEEGLTSLTIGERIKGPMQELITFIVHEKETQLKKATDEFVKERAQLENKIHQAIDRRNRCLLDYEMANIVRKSASKNALDKARADVETYITELNEAADKYKALAKEIQERL